MRWHLGHLPVSSVGSPCSVHSSVRLKYLSMWYLSMRTPSGVEVKDSPSLVMVSSNRNGARDPGRFEDVFEQLWDNSKVDLSRHLPKDVSDVS